jgi:hypothetical protein
MIEADGRTWITAAEAPDWLGPDITATLVRDWARRALVAGHRIGREVYYDLDTLTETEHAVRTSRAGRRRSSAQVGGLALQS